MTESGETLALERQRRWIRPNAHLFSRHDAWRFMPPGSPRYIGRNVVKYFEADRREHPSQRFEHKGNYENLEAESKGTAAVRKEIVALKAEVNLRRLLRALKAYNPNQLRVPAGNPDGGRWTNDGSATGNAANQTITNADGSSITAEVSASPDVDGWDERFIVKLADGTVTTFENSGPTQTIFDGDGRRLAESVWTDAGPELPVPQVNEGPEQIPLQLVQYAPAVPGPVGAALAASAVLYAYWSDQNRPDSRAILSFRADAFLPGATRSVPAVRVDTLTEEQVQDVCPRYAEVQSIADRVASSTDRGAYESAAAYGTAVHHKIAEEINGPTTTPRSPPRDLNFRAETSFIKSVLEGYGKSGTKRIDVLENSGAGTVCVYDIKTGTSGLAPRRALELASHVSFYYPGTQKIIVTEVRPRR